MTSDRILNLMALMKDIKSPSATYWRAVRRATETFTGSTANERAQDRGNAALLEIEQAVRAWVAEHPEPDTAADLERARSIAVALEQQIALATVLEIPRPGTGIPLQLRRIHYHGDRWAICDRTGRRWHREHGWVCEPDGIRSDEHLRDDTRFTLDEALPLAQQIALDGAE